MLASITRFSFVVVIGVVVSTLALDAQAQRPQYRNQAHGAANSHTQQGVDHVAPPRPNSRVAKAYVPRHIQTGVVRTAAVEPALQTREASVGAAGQRPRTMRTAQMISEAPVYQDVVGASVSPPVAGPVGGSACGGCGSCGGCATSTHTYSCGGCGSGSCSCGFGGPVDLGGPAIGAGFVGRGPVGDAGCGMGCGFDDCSNRGGCPPGTYENCWLNGLFGVFSTGELFIGGTGFRSTQFQVPGQNTIFDDASFGFQGGANFGMPLCNLTCGLLSGQLGVRAVTTEFDGNSFFDDNRDQVFFTGGLYRRVDYGLQGGVAVDVLREEWFTESETVQLRGDISWVYPSGSAFGFRFASQLQDDFSDGVAGGVPFTGLQTSIIETYRFYYRHAAQWGGYSDVSLGWSDQDHFVVGLDYDLPITETWAMRSSMTYLAGEDLPPTSPFAGNGNETWNLSVGFVWRPMGRSWYKRYDRPLFDVADNGSMIITRN